MGKIWLYIRENQDLVFIVLGQTFAVLLGLTVVYWVVTYIANLPGFQFDPFLIMLVAFLGWQYWQVIKKQSRMIEQQNMLIEQLSRQINPPYPALTGAIEPTGAVKPKKRTRKKVEKSV